MHIVGIGQPRAKYLNRDISSHTILFLDALREGCSESWCLTERIRSRYLACEAKSALLTFLISYRLIQRRIPDVLLRFGLYSLDYLQEVGRNFIQTTLKDVLVNNDEVCGFGVV